ncbi:alpha/beta fold hydrolase [Hydrogenophilus thiooxidans]|uniref:alpha/beta fold hydrolase n=1 Tax=Hydrogenophilus thiooxidans TaxID=2820326 RepID=UPI001C24CBB0|nr:alpha/beta fold hydrolase [Hydrogenophilus thiooxidans]
MKPPIVMLPGWRLGRGPLQPLADALGAEWYDLPGYRETPFTANFADAVTRLVATVPHGTILMGWSLGAMIALAAAARAPHHIGGVVAIGGTPSFVTRNEWPHGLAPQALAEFRAAIAEDEPAMLPRFVGGFNRGELESKTLTAEILATADPAPPLEILLAGLDWLATVDLRAELPRITAPVLVIHGENDPLIPCAAGEAIAQNVPHGKWLPIPNAAHAPFLRHQAVMVEQLSSFFW